MPTIQLLSDRTKCTRTLQRNSELSIARDSSRPHNTFLPPMPAIQIITTTPTRELAEEVAALLVERRLAACVQIDGPIQSTYRWEGKVEQDAEWRIVAKTVEERFDSVEAAIREMHPYDVPEILAVPVVRGSEDYLRWLQQEASGR